MKTLALVHTVASVIPMFQELCDRIMPDVRTCHLVDESVLRDLVAQGSLDPWIVRRVCDWIVRAEQGGADAILVTCSSISPCVDAAQPLVRVPALKIDEPMAQRAATGGGPVGVAATLPTTLGPTAELIRACARRRGRTVRIREMLCPSAFEALGAGRTQEHDEIVGAGIAALAKRVKTIVLAQASMARAAGGLDLPKGIRVLTSPESGTRRAAQVVRRQP